MRKVVFYAIFTVLFFESFVAFSQGSIITIAGSASSGPNVIPANDVPATSIAFYRTEGICLDPAGNIYVGDHLENVIKRIDPSTGFIYSFAGNGVWGNTGDGGLAINAEISATGVICSDYLGNIYIACGSIRKVNASTGIITTFAGGGSSLADSIPATTASISSSNVLADPIGNIYVIDGNKVRKIDAVTNIITTIATLPVGSGAGGSNAPSGLALDAGGNLYVADTNTVRKINTGTGAVSIVAGNCTPGYTGDGGPATNAEITYPTNLCVDVFGNLFIIEGYAGYIHIRKVDGATGIITTYATIGIQQFYIDVVGNIYFTDYSSKAYEMINSPSGSIICDSFSVNINKLCNGPQLTIMTNHYATGMSLKTYFGDGTIDSSVILGGFGVGYAIVNHNYAISGIYDVKHVLYNGGMQVDSLSYSYSYQFCRSLPVKLYYDDNGDCTKESSEPYINMPTGTEVDSNGVNIATLSTTSGFTFNAYGVPGDVYSFKVATAPGDLYVTCPASGFVYDTLQSAVNNYVPQYFGFSCGVAPGFDLAESVSMICGMHSAHAEVIINNTYCTPENATLTMEFDSKYIYQSSNPPPVSVVGNTITWDMSAVSASITETTNINVTLTHLGPFLPFGDTILSNFTLTPTVGDVNIANNIVTIIDTVKSGFDPNEMSVSPSGYIVSGTQLQYTINFENTGNDTAFNIVVMDTLSGFVDPATFKIVAASATMNTEVYYNPSIHQNIITFTFPNINLLDSSYHDECNGMIMFNINTLTGLPDGTPIFNHAGIFFDNNPVVMTDTVEDIIGLPAKVVIVKKQSDFKIFPNPTTSVLTIQMDKDAYSSYSVTNAMGQVLMQQPLSGVQTSVSVKALAAGLYYMTLRGDSGVKVEKFVKE